MKVAVVGAGAMGSLFGAMLAQADNEVWLYDVWDEHVQCINQDGLSIEREDQTRRVRIKATTDPDRIGRAELTIIFVKSTQTRSAAETARRIAGSDGAVMTLQNGMGNADVIAGYIEPHRILTGTTSHGATMLGAGRIRHAGIGATTIGSWAAGAKGRQRADQLAAFFNRAGIQTTLCTSSTASVSPRWIDRMALAERRIIWRLLVRPISRARYLSSRTSRTAADNAERSG